MTVPWQLRTISYRLSQNFPIDFQNLEWKRRCRSSMKDNAHHVSVRYLLTGTSPFGLIFLNSSVDYKQRCMQIIDFSSVRTAYPFSKFTVWISYGIFFKFNAKQDMSAKWWMRPRRFTHQSVLDRSMNCENMNTALPIRSEGNSMLNAMKMAALLLPLNRNRSKEGWQWEWEEISNFSRLLVYSSFLQFKHK